MGSPRYLDVVARVHNLDRNRLIGLTWRELAVVEHDDSHPTVWDNLLESREPQRLAELPLRLTPDSPDSIWDWTFTPIYAEDNRESIRYVLISAVEITEQVHVRQEVERLNFLKDEFIALASHELRTPLTSIIGNTEIMQRSVQRMLKGTNGTNTTEASKKAFEQYQHTLGSVLHQSHRLNSMINGMLDIARIQGAQFELHNQEHVELVALVRRVIENTATLSHRRITLDTTIEEITGTWDDARIEQVLNNLLTNAIKYSAEDQPIIVTIERNAHEVIVSVRDRGQGISEQQQEHIFDRFYRVHSRENVGVEGLGLGLYISREIITLQGGRMWLESTAGKGSTFYFSLPVG
jgi:signal transduction histidine kinase